MPLNEALRLRTSSVATTLNIHRFFIYSFLSTLAVCAVVANALRTYSNFYSVAISLSKSNRSVLALINFGFLVALLFGHVVQRIFFGVLRPNEIERLYDRLWFFITESLLAFTIFRDEFDIPFVLMFGFLLFVKSFHWLSGDRIEWMDQRPYPGPPLLFHIRMVSLFLILCAADLVMFLIAVESTLANGVGGMVLFASEFGILMASVLNTTSKYLLSAYELRRAGRRGGENAPPWEHKSMWVFYIELATDFLKLTTYLVFFTIIIAFYGLPLNIVRDVYITARSFISRLRALQRYQTATRNMDQRYPNATPEELVTMNDRTCIICREEMVAPETQGQTNPPATPDGPNTTPKKLPCGHIFHFHCLRSWLERQQSCPTCRRTVFDAPNTVGNTGAQVPAAPGDAQGANLLPPAAQNINPNQHGVNNPILGNPLGFLGRFFGPPVQQAIVPGQGPVPPPNPENGVQNPGNLQGLVVQYHIQYQPHHQQQEQQPRQALRPPPPFPGFIGPLGVWQPWPVGAQNEEEAQVVPSLPTTESGSTPTNALQDSSNSFNDLPSQTAVATGDENQEQLTARDAAALAALQRQNQNSDTTSTSETAPSNQPAPSTTSATSSLPSLIPMYDFSNLRTIPNGHVPTPTHGSTQAVAALQPSGTLAVPWNSTPRSGQTGLPRLPPVLSAEQLAILDRITREAIDERLRVLEGVSEAVYHCIDDLMRMRSTLPSLPPTRTAETTPEHLIETRGNGSHSGSGSVVDTNTQMAPNGKAPEVPQPGTSTRQ